MNIVSNTTEKQTPSGQDEDLGLVRRCQAGKKDAFDELVLKYQQKVFIWCYFLLSQSREDAEDAAQEVFCNVWRTVSGFKGDSKFSTWLHTVTRNHCFNIRKKQCIKNVITEAGEFRVKPQIGDSQTEDCVRQKVNLLDEIHRSVITLVHFDELSYEEAAGILKCPVGTIRSRVNRALEKLRPLIRECL
ncbi:MAG: sigma-70 family RNA polymerase sigma factor [Pseudomonadota bacterium]